MIERPELRIVSDDLWKRVHGRQAWLKQVYGTQNREGCVNRAASGRYLLSGFMRCACCGGNLVIVAGRQRDRHPQYGCPQNFYRGTCLNSLKQRQDSLEDLLLSGLQNFFTPAAIRTAVEEFGRQWRAQMKPDQPAGLRKQRTKLEGQRDNLIEAVAIGGNIPALVSKLTEVLNELDAVNGRIELAEGRDSMEIDLAEMTRVVTEELRGLRGLLSEDVTFARAQLGRHFRQITMKPDLERRHYIALGEWNLAGDHNPGVALSTLQAPAITYSCKLKPNY